MVEAGPSVPTPAPTMVIPAPVFIEDAIVVTGDLWDTRTAANNGCDPDGCVPVNTRVRGHAGLHYPTSYLPYVTAGQRNTWSADAVVENRYTRPGRCFVFPT